MAANRVIAGGCMVGVLLAIIWFSQQAWLIKPKAYHAQAELAQALGLTPLSAKRPDLLNIVSHAKLRNEAEDGDDNGDHNGHTIYGQIHNPRNVPIHAPSIVLLQIGSDSRPIKQLSFQPSTWRHPLRPIAANELAEFALPIADANATPNGTSESWGYQLQLRD